MKNSRYYIIPLVIGVMALLVPLLGDFHIESALVAALAGCFWAGWAACESPHSKPDGRRIAAILMMLFIAGVPLFIYALLTGCLNLHGIGYWILYPVPSVLLGYSLGRLLRKWQVPYRKFLTVAILAFIAVGILLIEFFNLPQVYFFNHVWGGWPGPIYDETITVSWSLVFFRGMTIAWAAVFWYLPAILKSTAPKIIVAAAFVLLMIAYVNLPEMGIITPRPFLKQELSGIKETEHFSLHYDENAYSEAQVSFLAQKHEFYYHQISQALNLDAAPQNKIESFLYAHPWQKKALVGAKFTSYVPVWLTQDQLHIAKQQVEGSLKHELVHVLAKQFGNNLFNASWSIGLVEGLAVALAPGESSTSTINQIVAAEKPYPNASQMQSALSPLGFYGGSSAVSYTESGSFVQHLLSNYPIENFKVAYRTADINSAYRASFESLVKSWHQALDTVRVDSVDQAIAERIYSLPSLFEKECPHVQSMFARSLDEYQLAMATGDTLHAIGILGEAFRESADAILLKGRWAYLNLRTDNFEKVQQAAAISDTMPDLLMLYADAFAMGNKPNRAQRYLEAAEQHIDSARSSNVQKALQLRQDSTQWYLYRSIIYKGEMVSDSIFKTMEHRTQIRILQQSLEAEQWPLVERYAALVENHKLDKAYFGTYIELVEWLVFWKRTELAEWWLMHLNNLPLRQKHMDELKETGRWISWFSDNN